MSALAREIRAIYKRFDDLDRRLHAQHMTGRVAEIDGDRVRLELLPADPRTGKPFLSPWVQVQEATGSVSTHYPVAIGDPMRLWSPHGELGPQSIATRDGYTTDRPNPSPDDELMIRHAGNELTMGEAGIRLRRGETLVHLHDGGVDINGRHIATSGQRLSHNDRNVGSTHTHGGVARGGASTNAPNP